MKKNVIYLLIIVLLAGGIFAFLELRGKTAKTPNTPITKPNQESVNTYSGENYYEADAKLYMDTILRLAERIEGLKDEEKSKESITITNDMFGNEIEEFQKTLEVENVEGEVETYQDMYLALLPYSDFLDVQKYYYVAGSLVMYRREFMGIGGHANYYFVDGKLINVQTEVEPEMEFRPEEENEILKRAKYNYQNFLAK